jgi:glycosyltransferase EpsF
VETLTLNLAKHTDPARVRYYFFVDADSKSLPHEEIADVGAELVVVPPYQRPIQHRRALRSEFSRLELDIVHAHTSTLVPFPLSAAKAAGVPIRIAHAHTMAGRGEYAKNLMKYSLRPFADRWATDLATSSLYAGEWLFGVGATERDEVFYLPVARDLAGYRYDPDERQRLREALGLGDAFTIGHLGRFVSQKNHLFLLECFQHVHEAEPNSVLLLAGDGDLLEQTQSRAVSLGLGDAVRFLGRRDDAAALYSAFDVFVLPSLYEGVPGTGVEAQAAGLPFVYSDAVTDEARLLPSTQRISLDAGAEAWASAILQCRGADRIEDAIERLDRKGFGIWGAAVSLTEYYEQLMSGRSLES